MKKILLIALISLTSIAYSGNKTDAGDTPIDSTLSKVKSILPDSAAITYKEVYSDIKSGLTALGSSLKVGADHVYGVLVTQQIVYSITYLMFIVICLAAWIPFIKIYKKGERDDWGEGLCIYTILVGGGLLALTICSFTCLGSVITGFINPEYGAIKEILEVIK